MSATASAVPPRNGPIRKGVPMVRADLFTTGESLVELNVHPEWATVPGGMAETAERARQLLCGEFPYIQCDAIPYRNRTVVRGAPDPSWFIRTVIDAGALKNPAHFARLFQDFFYWASASPERFFSLFSGADWQSHRTEVQLALRRSRQYAIRKNLADDPRTLLELQEGAVMGQCGEFVLRRLTEQMLQQMNVPAGDIRVLRDDDPLLQDARELRLGEAYTLAPASSHNWFLRRNGLRIAEWDLAVRLDASNVLLFDITTAWHTMHSKIGRLVQMSGVREKMRSAAVKGKNVIQPTGIAVCLVDREDTESRWTLQQGADTPQQEQMMILPLRAAVVEVCERTFLRFPSLRPALGSGGSHDQDEAMTDSAVSAIEDDPLEEDIAL